MISVFKPNYNDVSIRPGNREKSNALWVLFWIIIAVVLLHLLGIECFFRHQPPPVTAQPVAIMVSTITIPASQPAPAPPAPQQAKASPKKHQPKPKLKTPPRGTAGVEAAELEQFLQEQHQLFAAINPNSSQHEPASSQNPPIIDAFINPAYKHNPVPEYPLYARIKGLHGEVILRAEISEDGKVQTVSIAHSSGYQDLDESALEALQRWQFEPAKRGETKVSSSVLVPIIFSLEDQA